MAITVQITTTNYTVTATEVSSNINITVDSSTFTITNVVSNFTVTNVQPTITFTTDGTNGFDFASKYRGEWVSGTTYVRNDCVSWQDNFYVCQIAVLTSFVSTIPPSIDTTNWRLVIDVTSITTASITDLTVANMTVTNTFKLGPLYYSNTAGLYGQVLFTDGSSYANWTNLGDLVFWSLSDDLRTNGFNIRSDSAQNLKISSGTATNDYSAISLNANRTLDLKADTISLTESTAGGTPGSLSGTAFNATFRTITAGTATFNNNVLIDGRLSGATTSTFVDIGEGGLRFFDGTIQTSASTGSFTATQIATALKLGVIRVGTYLQIDPNTGILSVDAASLPETYTLPAASTSTRGGIKIGNGLTLSGPQNDVLNVSTSTQFGAFSLTQDSYTNGYLIQFSGSGGSALDLANSSLLLTASGAGLDIDGSELELSAGTQDILIQADTGFLTIKTLNQPVSIDAYDDYVRLRSPYTEIGRSATTSTLRVQNIYNYAGNYAPVFPAGIQFGDNSVQVTAWQTSTLIQSSIVVDFDNPFDP